MKTSNINFERPPEKRYTVARLLSMISGESASDHSFGVVMPLKGRVMMHGKGYSWLATLTGYWRVYIFGAEKIPLYQEVCFIVDIKPSFDRVQVWAYQITAEEYAGFEKEYRKVYKKFTVELNRKIKNTRGVKKG